MPEVSVVIPLYNKEGYVARAVRSVLAQSFDDHEVVVIDDGSADDSAAVVEQLGAPGLRLFRQPNAGVAAARNRGVDLARGRWVAFLDADDAWLPDKLERQLALLDRTPDLNWASGSFLYTGAGRPTVPIRPLPPAWFEQPDVLTDGLLALIDERLWTGTVMIRRSAFDELGGFESSYEPADDVEFWTRLAVRHPRLAYIQTPIAEYHRGIEGSLTHDGMIFGPRVGPELVRRFVDLATGLPPERAALLQHQARRLIVRQAKTHLAYGRNRQIEPLLTAGRDLELGVTGRCLALARHLPSGLTRGSIKFALNVRRFAQAGIRH